MMQKYDLSIGDLAQRTGIAQQTLRSWERRHGFPQAHRTASGHRRYSQREVELVHAVAAGREHGLSLSSAIAAALSVRGPITHDAPAGSSLMAQLCRRHTDLQPAPISKAMLVALSHAIEDEILARADPRVLFATFQRRRFYQAARARWRELDASSRSTVVFADFPRASRRPGWPIEIPIAANRPLAREWSIVYCGHSTSLCMSARETAGSSSAMSSRNRRFELVLNLDHQTSLEAAGICLDNTTHAFPELAAEVSAYLSAPLIPNAEIQLDFFKSILRRMMIAAFPPASEGSEVIPPMYRNRG